jgi:hypothetical protein
MVIIGADGDHDDLILAFLWHCPRFWVPSTDGAEVRRRGGRPAHPLSAVYRSSAMTPDRNQP